MTKTAQIVVRLEPDLREWLDERAESEGRSVSNLVQKLLREARAKGKTPTPTWDEYSKRKRAR